ncbi:alpha/beta hydrolase [Gordonia sp. NPDC003585]|uniref:alpha/beta hydrolase n=1 Tax=unclassified Gordonia (in: high G+C Gram-positive bacteria) TaxID=2657482 RepID=UPI0033A839D2
MSDVHVRSDISIATVNGVEITADLHRPSAELPPVVVYLHGGGWQLGDKADGADDRLSRLASYGVAVLSVNYRLGQHGAFPNPIHDVKGAVRWLRANGDSLQVATERVGVWGASAGAYLATMVGLTAGDSALEGDVGGNLQESSRVDAVVHWFGPSDLAANTHRSAVESFLLPPPFEATLIGDAEVDTPTEVSWQASPLSRVAPSAPPFLISHGDRDRITPPAQSRLLHDSLVGVGAESTLVVLGGAGHEGAEFDSPGNLAITAGFLSAQLNS